MTHTPQHQLIEPPTDPQLWVDRHGDYLFRFALARVGRREVAEDLVQESLLAAWRGRANFAGKAQERSWLTAILKRKVIDWLRQAVRERTAQPPAASDEWVDGQFTRLGEWRKGPKAWTAAAPDDDVERDEFWATVRGCSDKLPPRLRAVFLLWHLEERPTTEVCEAAGVSASNLWVMLHRARLRLWRCLSENWYGVPHPTRAAGDEP